MSDMEFATKIKDLRLKRKMTLEQVAEIVGVGKSTVRKWETGQIANMGRDKIASLSLALGVTPSFLMGWDSLSSVLSPHENKVITAYRDKPLVQPHVDKLLDIQPESGTVLPMAAYDGSDERPAFTTKEEIDAAPDLKL